MKGSILTYVAFVVLAIGAISVSGQDIVLTKCLPDESSAERTIRRAPKAESGWNDRGEFVYKINANETWRRTDLEVKRGQRIEITATGIIKWAPDNAAWTTVTPNGTVLPDRNGWNTKYFPYPDAGIGSLVLRIGKAVYPAGSSVVIESEDDGFVEFQINDDVLADNSGHFLVRIAVQQM